MLLRVSCASYIVTHKLILYPHSQALYHDAQCCQSLHCRHRHRQCLLTFRSLLIPIKIYLFFFLQNLEKSLGPFPWGLAPLVLEDVRKAAKKEKQSIILPSCKMYKLQNNQQGRIASRVQQQPSQLGVSISHLTGFKTCTIDGNSCLVLKVMECRGEPTTATLLNQFSF